MKKTTELDPASGQGEKNESKLTLGVFPVFPDPSKRHLQGLRVLLGRVPEAVTGEPGARPSSDTNKPCDLEHLAALGLSFLERFLNMHLCVHTCIHTKSKNESRVIQLAPNP